MSYFDALNARWHARLDAARTPEIAAQMRALDDAADRKVIDAVGCDHCGAARGVRCFPASNAQHFERAFAYATGPSWR